MPPLLCGIDDNDGHLDLIIANGCLFASAGECQNELYKNKGDGSGFVMVTGTALSTQKNSAVSWGDFDGDGDLDLVVGKRLGNSLPNELYRNDLHLGTTPPTFTQITGTPISDLSFNGAYTFAWGDFDQDGKLDLAIGSATANGLMRNLGGGVFEAVTGTAITAS